MKKNKKKDYKDILIRALKTFIQGFLASLVVFIQESPNVDERVLKSALIGACAGGLSAVMNIIIQELEVK